MLEDIRQGAKGPMGKVLVVVISLAFGLWGVSTVVPLVFGGSAPVTVNGERITEAEIAQRVFQERQGIIEQFGGQIDPSFLRDEFIRPQAINQLIVQRLISQAASEHGFVLSEESLNRVLARQPAFQDQGRFSSEVFSRIAARQGLTASQLRDQIGANEVAQQWVNGLMASEFVLSNEIAQYGNFLHQTRNIDYLTFDPEDFRAEITVQAEDVQAFYDQQSSRFQTPERVSVNYVRLLPEQILADWMPSASDLEEAYRRYLSQQQSQRNKFVSHLLISLESRSDDEALALAQELRQRALGEDFAQLAETYSDDAGSASQGGALGQYDADVFLPEFAAVVASLESAGDISEVFPTAFGYHIVKLDTVTSPSIASFDDMRETLTKQLADRYLSTRLPILREELEALAFSGLDLTPIADAFGLVIEQSPLFDPSGSGWNLATRDVLAAAFSPQVLDDGLNSDVLFTNEGGFVVLRRDQFEPSSVLPLADVDAEIHDLLRNEAMIEMAQTRAQSAFAELQNNPLQASDWLQITALTRFDEALPPAVVESAFRVQLPESSESPVPFIANTTDGLWVVGRVTEVLPGEPVADEAELVLSFLSNELSTDGIDGLLNHLQATAKIRIR
jgi:peptidyl-prolyl cis-trans isomerase D